MHRKNSILDYDQFMFKFVGMDGGEELDIFHDLPTPTKEMEMYNTMPGKLNESNICPGYVFIAHPSHSNKSNKSNLAVDCGMYLRQYVPQDPAGKFKFPPVHWSELEIPIECKTEPVKEDPFEDDSPYYEPTVDTRKSTLGQLLSYAELMFRHQQRTFFFMIIFIGNFARILRVDRSSIFATEKFNYKIDPEKLSLFLSRYARLTKEERGHDSTAALMRPRTKRWDTMLNQRTDELTSYAQKLFSASLDEDWPWWELKVPSGGVHHKRFLVGKPHFIAPGVVGRGTRGYVALPVDSRGDVCGDLVYLKDAWRVDHPGIELEGATLQELNDQEVSYVPTLVCHGDLVGVGQVTDWREFWAEWHSTEKIKVSASDSPLKRHQHYRLVVREVGKPLHEYGDSSIMLIWALLCCLTAHQQAYGIGIIHRDISAGNILIVEGKDGLDGMLNDWELSKRFDPDKPDVVSEARQPDRTGTWQFMSAHALNDEDRPIVLEDELESVLHVLLYIAIRFLRSNLVPQDVGQFLHNYFDTYSASTAAYHCGLTKLNTMMNGSICLVPYNGEKDPNRKALKFYWPQPTGASTASVPQESQSDAPPAPSSTEERSSSPALQECPSSPAPLECPSSPSPQGRYERSPSPTTHAPPSTPLFPSDVDPSKNHPINSILDELLSWFKAYYAEETVTKDSSAAADNKSKSNGGDEGFADFKRQLKRKSSRPSNVGGPSIFDAPPTFMQSPEDVARQAALRDKLRSHEPMVALLEDSLHKAKWPKQDRVKDMKPKMGYDASKNEGPLGLTTGTSQKRSREDDLKTTGSRKRSKV